MRLLCLEFSSDEIVNCITVFDGSVDSIQVTDVVFLKVNLFYKMDILARLSFQDPR